MAGRIAIHHLDEVRASPVLTHRWCNLLGEAGDIFYDLSYLAMATVHEAGSIHLAIYEDDEGTLVYPFVLRRIPEILRVATGTRARFDIATPYGYGGPLLVEGRQSRSICERYFKAFSEYCMNVGIVSEFVRFHPILHTELGFDGLYDVELSCPNILFDLSLDDAALFGACDRRTQRYIRQAERWGVRAERAEDPLALLDTFTTIYWQTMERLQARRFFYFSEAYFRAMFEQAGDKVQLYISRDKQGEILSTAIFLNGDRFSHYHLGGSADGMGRLHCNNLLFFEVAKAMKRQGIRYLHLGGASSSQQGLYRFKCGFSSTRDNYFIGRSIYLPEDYVALCSAWKDSHPEQEFPTNYFPGYRL
jgi:hypothetical protein